MRKFYWFLLFFICFRESNQQAAAANHLLPVVNDLSIVARLLNGISLQNEFMQSSDKLNAVIAELLELRNSTTVSELLKMDVKTFSNDVDGVLTAMQNLPTNSTYNTSSLKVPIQVLHLLNVKEVKEAVKKDFTELQGKWSAASDVEVNFFTSPEFHLAAADLNFVMNRSLDTDNRQQMIETLINLSKGTVHIGTVFGRIKKKQKNLDDLWAVSGTKPFIKDMVLVAKALKDYWKNFGAFQSLAQSLTDLKTRISSLDGVIKKSQARLTKDEILEVIGGLYLSNRPMEKLLTSGLLNGGVDLKTLFEDLKGKWISENIGGGKDMTMMVTALMPLQQFQKEMSPLSSSWETPRSSAELRRVVSVLVRVLQSSKMTNPTDLMDKSENGAKCVTGFKQVIKADKLMENFNTFWYNLDRLDDQLIRLKKAFEKITNSQFLSKIAAFDDRMFLENVDAGNLQSMMDAVRNYPDMRNMSELISEYSEKLKNLDLDKMQKTLKLWKNVQDVQETVTSSGLSAAIDCLNNMQFDLAGAEAFSRFDDSVQILQTEKKRKEHMHSFLEAVGVLQKSEKKLKTTVEGMKSRNRKLRDTSGTGSERLLKLVDSEEVARKFGEGVQTLKQMAEVMENQARVLSVVKTSHDVDSVINAIPEMGGNWTVDNKKALKMLVDEVNALNKNSAKFENGLLKSLWEMFGEAQSVRGAPIDGRLLGELVFTELAQNPNASVNSEAKMFQAFPPLQLDFASSKQANLRAAYMLRQPIVNFFADFFNVHTVVKTSTSEPQNIILYVVILVVTLLICIALAVIAFFGYKAHQKNARWKNRERHWIYSNVDDLGKNSLVNHIELDDFDRVTELIKAGYYVNEYDNGVTPLHCAVEKSNAKLVELLIRHGANREALSAPNRQTPEQLLIKLMAENKVKELESAQKKVKAVFDKYRKRTFKQTIPPLMHWRNFSICSFAADRSSALQTKYDGELKFTNSVPNSTHIIVDVDSSHVYHYDETSPNSMEKFYDIVFGKQVVVSSRWAEMCVQNKENFSKDYEYRVTKVEFRGVVYSTVDKWKEYARKRHVPFGEGIQLSYLSEHSRTGILLSIGNMGFTTIGAVNLVQNVDPSIRPFYRSDINPHFIVFEGKSLIPFEKHMKDVNRKDYTIMSLDDFTKLVLELNETEDTARTTMSAVSSNVSTRTV